MIKVSVILPNYNHAQYLDKRIESILQQTFQDFELIIIDDCSTDDSRAVLEGYRNNSKVAHLIYNTKNSGTPFGSWERGIGLAQGKYIWIAESDDWADPLFLETTVQQLEANPKAGIAYTDSIIINEEGTQIGIWKTVKNKQFKTQKWTQDYYRKGTAELLENMLVVMTVNNMSACLLRKTALPNRTALQPLKGAGDWLLCGLILLEHGISYSAKPLNYYRTHPENVTKFNDKSGLLLVENAYFYSLILPALQRQGVTYQPVEAAILNRYLFKYTTVEYLTWQRKMAIRRQMFNISGRIYRKFLWRLFKYRIKHFFSIECIN